MAGAAIWGTWRNEYQRGIDSLGAIAQMRATQVEEWVAERRNDALQKQARAAVADAAGMVVAGSGAAAGSELERRLTLSLDHHCWDDALLLDPGLKPVWTMSHTVPDVAPPLRGAAMRARGTGAVTQAGPYLDGAGRAWVDFVVPLRASHGRRALVLVMRSDPARSLFTIVRTWPIPSQTAETVLCRREGDTVLFLTDLRFRPGSAMRFRAPIKGNRLGAARFVEAGYSNAGLGDALDYRGRPVVSVGHAVEGTDWFLGAKMDRSEVTGAALPISLGIGLAGLLAMLAAATGAFLLHERQAHTVQVVLEERARADTQRLRRILDNLPTAVAGISRSPDAETLFVNQRYRRVFGFTEAEAPTLRSAMEQSIPDEAARRTALDWWSAAVARAAQGDGLVPPAEHRIVGRDGAELLVSISGAVLDDLLIASFVDITDAARTAEELKATKERLEAIVDAVPDLMFVVDRHGAISGCYSPLSSKLYAQPDEFVGRHVSEVLPPDAAAIITDAVEEAAETGAHQGAVYALDLPDGRSWFELSIAAMGDVTGPEAHFLALARDVTQRVRLEEELRRREEQYRLLADNSADVITMTDTNGAALYISPSVERFRGFTPEEAMAQTVDMVLAPEDAAQAWAGMAAVGAAIHAGTALPTFRMDCRQTRKDGSYVWADLSASCMVNDQGRHIGMLVVSRDISERKRLEEELRRSEEQYRLLAENATDIIFTMDPSGRFTYSSPSAERLRGYTTEEAVAQTLDEALTPASAALARAELAGFLTASASPGSPHVVRVELEVTCKDGSTLWLEVTASGRYGPDNELVAVQGIARDTTERRRYEHELREARRDAEAANAAKSRFLAHMSHEIRTPLNGVLGLAQVLLHQTEDAEQRSLVTRIQSSGRTLTALLNDLLDHSKIEAGKMRLEARPFDPAAVLGRVAGLMGADARAKGLEMRLDLPAEPLPALIGDELRVEQILLNLVGNAVKFTETGFVRLAAACDPAGPGAVSLCIEVIDSGIGIAAEGLENLFEPFLQADVDITRRYGGTGLGLSISRRLAEAMGGRLTAESRLGHGSCFRFEALFDLAPAAVPAAERPGSAARGPRLRGLHLLVADDSAVSRDVALSMLQLEGATADHCANGLEALEALRAGPGRYDAVLMDLHMPEVDGITATRRMRKDLHLTDLPVIALTAAVLDAERAAALGVGVNAVLAKPVDIDLLVSQVRSCLGLPEVAGAEAPEAPEADPEALPELPGIDPARLWRSAGGNRTVLDRLVRLFAAEFHDVAERARRRLAGGDIKAAARLMHTLKGSAAIMGADGIAASAAALEAAALRDEPDLEQPLGGLERMMAELAAAISLAGADRRASSGEAVEPTPEKLAELRQALQKHDMEALTLFDQLDAGLHRLLGDGQAADLREAVTHLRFDEALAMLAGPGTA